MSLLIAAICILTLLRMTCGVFLGFILMDHLLPIFTKSIWNEDDFQHCLLYTSIIPSSIFAILMGCLFWNIQKNGIRNVIISYLTEMRHNRRLIYQCLFFLYVYFIFDRTLLSRHFGWSSGIGNIMGGWTLLDPETGKVTFEDVYKRQRVHSF